MAFQPFVDDLGLELFILAFVGFILDYAAITLVMAYRKGENKEFMDRLRALSVPLGILGFFIFIMGIAGELVWPLPNFGGLGYDILFFDAFTLLGVILMSIAVAVNFNRKLEYTGMLSFMFGLTVIFYGITAYNLKMTKEPLAMLLLYAGFGISGILALPASIAVDKAIVSPKVGKSWLYWTYSFILFMALSALAAVAIAAPAIASHLASAP